MTIDRPQPHLWQSTRTPTASTAQNLEMARANRLSDVEWTEVLCESSLSPPSFFQHLFFGFAIQFRLATTGMEDAC